jgi:hypothetical protein
MAIELPIITDSGIDLPTCYVKVSSVMLNIRDRRVEASVDFFKDKASRLTGKDPVSTKHYEIFDFPTIHPGTSGTPAVEPAGQHTEVSFEGLFVPGNIFTIVVNGKAYTHTSTAVDVDLGGVAKQLVTLLVADVDLSSYQIFSYALGATRLVIKHKTIGVPFTVTVEVQNTDPSTKMEAHLITVAQVGVAEVPGTPSWITYADVYDKYFADAILASAGNTVVSCVYEYLKTLPAYAKAISI